MAFTWACPECLKGFKTVKGKNWHERRWGHRAVRLAKDHQRELAGLTRAEANELLERVD